MVKKAVIKEEKEEKPDSDERRIYEVGFLISPLVVEEDIGVMVSGIKETIEKLNGVCLGDEFPIMRNLAYDIEGLVDGARQKFSKAYFGFIKFDVMPDSVVKLKKEFDSNKNVIRFILVQTVIESAIVKKPSLVKMTELKKPSATDNSTTQTAITQEPSLQIEELDKTIEDLVID